MNMKLSVIKHPTISPMNRQKVKSAQESLSSWSSGIEDNFTTVFENPNWRNLNSDLYNHLDKIKAVILPREEFRSYTRPPIFEIYEGNVYLLLKYIIWMLLFINSFLSFLTKIL